MTSAHTDSKQDARVLPPATYTPAEAARLVQVSKKTFMKWISLSLIPGTFRAGRQLRIRRADFDKFLSRGCPGLQAR
jgi:excisionase family DNA binding protein